MHKNSNHIPRVDALRAVAILLVFSQHFDRRIFGRGALEWHSLWGGWKDHPGLHGGFFRLTIFNGHLGVVLFFVISGLCIRLSHRAQSSFSVFHFYWRRFWRVYPPYLIALLFFALLERAPLHDVLAHAFLVHNFSPVLITTINAPFWSLALEFQVYLLYPVLLLMHDRCGGRATFAILSLLAVVCELCAQEGVRSLFHLPGVFAIAGQMPFTLWVTWYAGFLVADRFVDNKPVTLARRCILLSAICLVPLGVLCRPLTPFVELVNAIAISFLIDEFLRCRLPGSRLGGLIGLVGASSYSFYLYFDWLLGLLLSWLTRVHHFPGPRTLFTIGYPVVFLAIAMFSYAAYRIIELPGMALGRWLFARLHQRKHAETPAV